MELRPSVNHFVIPEYVGFAVVHICLCCKHTVFQFDCAVIICYSVDFSVGIACCSVVTLEMD